MLRRHVWLWPLLFASVFAFVGYGALRALQRTMQEHVRDQLTSTLDTAVEALSIWAEQNRAVARLAASDEDIAEPIRQLAALHASGSDRNALLAHPAQQAIRAAVKGLVEQGKLSGWGAQARDGTMLANPGDHAVGRRPRTAQDLLAPIFAGEAVLTEPIFWDSTGDGSNRVITIVAGAPVRGADGEVVSSFGFALNPDEDFTRILDAARPGRTGETYAFNDDGLLVSHSRFEDELKAIGLLDDADSTLHVHVRDPGGDMTQGFVPDLAPRARPLTRMAADAISGNDGYDLEGYRDYRGVPVVGAWRWLPEVRVGITSEIDVDEAYDGLYDMQMRFYFLIGLLVTAALGMGGYSLAVMRLRDQVQEAKQLGRYKVEKKIGAGGMGTVFLARHALLRRPTAIKVLDSSKASEEAVGRFEREVQVTSALRHPNTVDIYDYGYTPDGTFYYAMELLDGITLAELAEAEGALPEGRVVHIMSQVAASLSEAHAQGLIHRDLKPANIMLCEQGGLPDFVKVLDFGLVRAEQQSADVALTSVDSLTGTPLYMSPECVEDPSKMDVRSDVYQLGGIAYYLLTGRHVFTGKSVVDVLSQHLSAEPVSPSDVLGRPVTPELERLVLDCLAKAQDDRPRDAGELLEALEAISIECPWSTADARAWWSAWHVAHPARITSVDENASGSSLPSGYSMDIERRKLRSRG